jgi:hypothetical protein
MARGGLTIGTHSEHVFDRAMSLVLSSDERERLLRKAREASRRLSPSAARQAATALAIVRRDGVEALDEAMDERVDVLLGANATHWDEFRRALRPVVRDVFERHGVAGVAYFLGWVKRLASIAEAGRSADRSPHGARSASRAPRRRR